MNFDMFKDDENMPLVKYEDIEGLGFETVKFSDLSKYSGDGVLKACTLKDGKLLQMYTAAGNHVGVIAATRLGKTTGYVIPTIISFAKQKVKKSMIISDPKGEVYRLTAETLRREGYNVKLLNFRDRRHSEYWNPLTPIFRKYMEAVNILDKVELVQTQNGPRNKFMGKVYEDQSELEYDVEMERKLILEDVDNEIDDMGTMFITTVSAKDPTWEDGARDLFKAFLYAMLEDVGDEKNPITEETFSLKTMFDVKNTFSNGDREIDDGGYFRRRGEDSKAKSLATPIIIMTQRGTGSSYLSVFQAKLAAFQETTTKMVTSCNSFEIDELTDSDKPVALYIAFKDEVKSQYQTITLFVQAAYRHMIEVANSRPNGQLDVPFYFILDEFGNFPAMRDFENTISACAGRNIWFILVIQSYAQLEAVYGKDVSTIIKDNLNMHVFFGSNNPETLKAFSEECGRQTRISPISAISGNQSHIDKFEKETIALIPVSKLVRFACGECIITEANCGYVMMSKLERYYMCDEFKNLPLSYEKDYVSAANPLDEKYQYRYRRRRY